MHRASADQMCKHKLVWSSLQMLMERSYSLWMIVCAGWRTQPGADRGKWGGGGGGGVKNQWQKRKLRDSWLSKKNYWFDWKVSSWWNIAKHERGNHRHPLWRWKSNKESLSFLGTLPRFVSFLLSSLLAPYGWPIWCLCQSEFEGSECMNMKACVVCERRVCKRYMVHHHQGGSCRYTGIYGAS